MPLRSNFSDISHQENYLKRKIAFYKDILSSVEAERDQIANSYFRVRILRLIEDCSLFLRIIIPLAFIIALIIVLGIEWLFVLIFISIILILPLISIFLNFFSDFRKKLEARILASPDDRLIFLEEKQKKAQNEIYKLQAQYQVAFNRLCVNYPTYPPDWEIRSEKVKRRDSYCCTICGWPKGFKRKRRQLHIHHKVPLSEGGDNSLENLVTLCNICHKKISSKRKPLFKKANINRPNHKNFSL